MRCPRCGNENPADNRFCGMCGATMLPTSEVPVQPVRAAMPPASVPAPPTPRMEPPRVDSTRIDPTRIDAQRIAQRIDREPSRERQAESIPAISGPSFLGLNDPAPTRSADPEPRRASLSIDPHSEPPSRSLEYLLNDDDHNDDHGGGAGKIFVILFLVIALGVTGYLTWKNHGFGWITLGSNKPTAINGSRGLSKRFPIASNQSRWESQRLKTCSSIARDIASGASARRWPLAELLVESRRHEIALAREPIDACPWLAAWTLCSRE